MTMGKLTGVEWTDGTRYLFRDAEYVRVDQGQQQAAAGYPKSIAEAWSGVFDSGLDAVVAWPNGKAYFFRGAEYVRYDIATDAADSAPAAIAGNWPGMDEAGFGGGVDAALLTGEKAYFMHGDRYVRYDVAEDRVDADYPKPIAGNWPGLQEAGFADAIDAAIGTAEGKAYIVKGDRYVRYDLADDRADPGFPQPLEGTWLGAFAGGAAPAPTPTPSDGSLFAFVIRPGEATRDRVVRCCEEALTAGPMGEHERHDFYREFISCRQEPSEAAAEALTGVRTSCAMFVRAVLHWCGGAPQGPYRPGTGMFKSMGNVSFAHPSFVAHDGARTPQPGDYFYIASSQSSNDGHTGIFLEEESPGLWRTAEGGGGDGTQCRLTERTFAGTSFREDPRRLWGWFDCTKVGLPEG
jgi:hypothetical protein